MAGASYDREKYKVAIPQLDAKLKKLLDENVEISQKLRIFAAELMCAPPHVFAGHSRVVAVG